MTDTDGRLIPEDLHDAPPAPRLVYLALEHADDPVTTTQLVETTGLPERTVRDAINRLRDRDVARTYTPGPQEPNAPRHRLRD